MEDVLAQLAEFRGVHHGEAMVVCGLGNSIHALGDPFRFRTIGVNDIERAFTPTYMFCMDAPKTFPPDRLQFIQNSRARYIFTDHDLGIARSNIVRFPIRRSDRPHFDDPNVMYFTDRPITSPYIAICLAAHMGAKAIGLIGVDFTAGHFFASDGVHKLTNGLAGIDRRFYALGSALAERGVKVFNLSAESRIRAFPRLTPDEFWELQQSGQAQGWTRRASRIYLYSCLPVTDNLAALAKLINTRTTCSCRLSAPDSPDIEPGSMPDVEQAIADDSHVDLDCDIAPLAQQPIERSNFEQVWTYAVRPLLFAPKLRGTNGHKRLLTLGVIVSQERSTREEMDGTLQTILPALGSRDEVMIISRKETGYRLPAWISCAAPVAYVDQMAGESFVSARNRAARSCTTDLLVFTDANAETPLDWAEALADVFRKTQASAVGPAIADLYRPNVCSFGMNFRDPELDTIALAKQGDEPYPVPLLSNTFLAIRRDVMVSVNGFDGRMRASGADDLELCFRLWTSGYECHVAPQLAIFWMNPFQAGALRSKDYWPDLLHNLLRLATVHFSPERLGAFIERAIAHPEYPEVAAAMVHGALAEWRDRVRAMRQHSDDWFFDRFAY